MAQMYPARFTEEVTSSGERDVFDRLKDAPDDWIVLHSLRIAPRPGSQRRGEADFVVIVPGYGVAVLEIKTYAHETEDGLWIYKPGIQPVERSPFEQAETAMQSIANFLRQKMGSKKPWVVYGVVTPFGDLKAISHRTDTLAWNEWQAIGQAQIQRNGLPEAIRALLDREATAAGLPASPKFDAEQTKDVLRPRFELRQTPACRRRALEEDLIRYTKEQFDVLDDLEANHQLVVEGPAGTGKTIIAIEAAMRASELGMRTLFLCYNERLGKWLDQQLGGSDCCTVSTIHSHMLRVAGLPGGGQTDSVFWQEDLPMSATLALIDNEWWEPFDLLVVDEAQDALASPGYLEFLSASLDGQLADGKWLFVGDFEKQDIFRARGSGSTPFGLLETASGRRPYVRPLRKNCRNTPEIASFAETAGNVPADHRYRSVLRSPSGTEVQVVAGPPEADVPHLARILDLLRKEGFANDEITILSLAGGTCATARQLQSADATFSLAPLADERSGAIACESVRRFKGLESPVVVLTDVRVSATCRLDQLSDLLYVGATRAVDRLYVLVDQETAQDLALS